MDKDREDSGDIVVTRESIEEIDGEREKENLRKIEAALFIAGKYLNLKELVALTDVNPILLRKLLEDLSEKYRDSALQIVQRDNLWKMDVAEEYVGMVNTLATGSSEFTKAEQETLAIIAYKQPIKQSVLVKIRGNKAYDHVKDFVSQGLVIKKRVGHTAELSLSDGFYEYFNLEKKNKSLFTEKNIEGKEE